MVAGIRPQAAALVRSALASDDRVLVTGSGGWFGTTLVGLLAAAKVTARFTTRRPRTVRAGGVTVEAEAWDLEAISRFEPTVVIDCAFVLRDYLGDSPLAEYVLENTRLTSRLLQLAQLDSVRGVVSVSSGAAVHPVDASRTSLEVNPYGYLKRQAELGILELCAERGIDVVVARPWSLSGGMVARPERYAFSDLILQARTARIDVRAEHQVFRRYSGTDDFFAVVLGLLAAGGRRSLNSGGELVEFRELATRIAARLGSAASIHAAPISRAEPDDYYARDTAWDDACAELAFAPASLDEQITDVADELERRGI